MRRAVVFICLALSSFVAHSEELPALAKQYAPLLADAQQEIWPDAPVPWFLGGQVEQETCPSLRSKKCWNPRAELKTKRENGIGLGQFTRAYKADGSIRFDKISELARAHASLRGWSWESRYSPEYQLKAIVEMDKAIYRRQRGAASVSDTLAFSMSGYNGGEGGVLQDRRLCANTPGCDDSQWFGHVECTSIKSKKPSPGYSVSFFSINRDYVRNVLYRRMGKYESFFSSEPKKDGLPLIIKNCQGGKR